MTTGQGWMERLRRVVPAVCVAVGLLAAGSAGAGATSQINLSRYEKAVRLGEAPLTKWPGPTTPVRPPKHKFVVLIPTSMAAEGAVRPIMGAQAAAKALGWRSLIIDGQGLPNVYNSDILKAISLHANAIVLAGIDQALVRNAIEKARKAGIIVVSATQGNIPNPHGVFADVSPDYTAMGQLMAAYMIVSTRGHVDAVPFNDPEYTSVVEFLEGAIQVLKTCSTCKVYPMQTFTVNQMTTVLPQMTVNFLQTHSDANAVLSGFDAAAVFQIQAIKAAHLAGRVKLYSWLGDLQNLNFIRQGQVQVATVGSASEWAGWGCIDEILRIMDHMPVVAEHIPSKLLVKGDLPPAGQPWRGDINFEAHFRRLWGLG